MKNYCISLCLLITFITNCSEKQNTLGLSNENNDVDLTVLSSIMVYAEVYNIMTNPEDYLGKTIKAKGMYYSSYYQETDMNYHYVVISDAASCCSQGLEFKLNGSLAYQKDYPESQTEIELAGVFSSYDELDETYYYLAVEDITILR